MRTLLTRNVGLQPDARGKHFPPEVVYMTEEQENPPVIVIRRKTFGLAATLLTVFGVVGVFDPSFGIHQAVASMMALFGFIGIVCSRQG